MCGEISTPENVSALNLLRHVNEMIQNDEDELPSQSDVVKVRNYLNTDTSAKGGLSHLCHNLLREAWWGRVWVIQEVAVSSRATVVIGESELEWPYLCHAIGTIMRSGVFPAQHTSLMDAPEEQCAYSLIIIEALRLRAKQGSLLSISALVAGIRQAATDPRDLVYALLGLAKERKNPLLTPNYSSTNTASATFISLIEYSVRFEKTLDIICLSQGKIRKDFPSWCPDWSQPPRLGWDFISDVSDPAPFPLIPTYLNWLAENLWHACGDKSPVATIIRSPLTLACKGLLVDVVEVIGDPIIMGYPPIWNRLVIDLHPWESLILDHFKGLESKTLQPVDDPSIFDVSDQYHRHIVSLTETPNLEPWGRISPATVILGPLIERLGPLGVVLALLIMILESLIVMSKLIYSAYRIIQKLRWKTRLLFQGFRSRYITGGSLAEAYVRTLITNRLIDGSVMTDKDYRLFWSKVPKSLNFPPAPDTAPVRELVASSLVQHLAARTLVLTKKGYLGLGPKKARKGDLVCILYGCSVPVIIREHGQGHEFVGESYIYGLMDGAAVNQQSLRDTLEEREFILE